jgi:hypothetical protein
VGTRAAAVTLSDSVVFPPAIIQCGGAGTVNVTDTGGNDLQFTVVAGGVLPVLCIKCRTGGTATAVTRTW